MLRQASNYEIVTLLYLRRGKRHMRGRSPNIQIHFTSKRRFERSTRYLRTHVSPVASSATREKKSTACCLHPPRSDGSTGDPPSAPTQTPRTPGRAGGAGGKHAAPQARANHLEESSRYQRSGIDSAGSPSRIHRSDVSHTEPERLAKAWMRWRTLDGRPAMYETLATSCK